jgi:TupA-like ATPgrasp
MLGAIKSEFPFRVVYVITCDGRDAYADMALVSMLSVRISNPGLDILAVCDQESALALSAKKHRLLKVCDELMTVPTPDGEPTFRSRWIKTQLCRYAEGSVLFLDADTLVRGSLVELPRLVSEVGAVANHNGATLSEQIWIEDQQFFEGMGWAGNFQAYVNSGVFFFKPYPRVREFFATWHRLWLAGVSARGRLRDQPSFNTAIVLSGVEMKVLPSIFNVQVAKSWNTSSQAVVWHFYALKPDERHSFWGLVKVASGSPLTRLNHSISRALTMPAPWPNFGWFARRLVGQVELRGSVRTEEWLWLHGRRKDALRFVLGKAWNGRRLRMLKRRMFRRSDGERILKARYRSLYRQELDCINPLTFSAKLFQRMIWINRNGHPVFTRLADKYRVRDYVTVKLGPQYLVKLLWHGVDPHKIPFDTLPEHYVIKTNHWSGGNVVVRGAVDHGEIIEHFSKMLRESYYWLNREYHYHAIPPQVLIEELLDDGEPKGPLDYRFYCFDGVPELIQVTNNDQSVNQFHDRQWKALDLRTRAVETCSIARPDNLEQMLAAASTLGADFDFVRVDLYDIRGQVRFSEMTFTPGAGLLQLKPAIWDVILGQKWKVRGEALTAAA